jgi:ubiquinone/menaquinone biosynthesis C-methylase UbiE
MTDQNPFPMHTVAKEAGGSLQFLHWALQQLNIQPYQHLLEVGYGTGHLTEEVARSLRIGFIAGIESSISLYQQAYRRNKRFVSQQLVQLHVGELYELSYPPHYFHTIYGTNIHLLSNDIHSELLRLSGLLKNGGRLVLLLEAGRDPFNIHETALLLREACSSAGFSHIHTRTHPLKPDKYLAITGFKA